MLTERIDRMVRCAAPIDEPVNAVYPLGEMPQSALIIGTDGSQILPSAHGLPYGLANAAAILMPLGSWSPNTIETRTETEIFCENLRINKNGVILSEESIDLYRDVRERELMVECALSAGDQGAVFSLSDGSPEVFGARDSRLSGDYHESFEKIVSAYKRMKDAGRAYGGFVSALNSQFVVRLLEVVMTPQREHRNLRKTRPLIGLTDDMLFQHLPPGMRSAIFSLRTRAHGGFSDDLTIHFSYLNVAKSGPPVIARLEFPRYLLDDRKRLDEFHRIVWEQCQIIPNVHFPYVLQQAHKLARVSRRDQAVVERQLIRAYLNAGLSVPGITEKLKGKGLT